MMIATLRRQRPVVDLIVTMIFAIAIFEPNEASAQTSNYWAIRFSDQLIGYAEVTELKADDLAPIREVRNTVRMKIALRDQLREISIDGTTRYDDQGRVIAFLSHLHQGNEWSETECTFEGTKALIRRRSRQQPEPATTTLELSESWTLLAANDFGHWNALATRIAQQETVSVDLQTLTPESSAELKPLQAKRIERLDGDPIDSQRWSFGDASLLIDSRTGRFLELDLEAQQTQVTRADSTIVDEFRDAPEADLLALHFIRSPERLDEPSSITQLQVKLKTRVIGSGPSNAESVLASAMQVFDGEKREDWIEGEFTISTIDRPTQRIPAFPELVSTDDLQVYLKPEPMIESDAEPIVELAQQLTSEATDRWQAVQAIADWTFRSIRYKIADTPSALEALQKREGDCGPHATLTVALLRAQGIPARLVGGLVYTPSFGGSFGQHAWVEVHLGEHGWVSLDPTTGEIERMSATHIKLFEGMGGVLPDAIEVIDYQPRPAPLAGPQLDGDRVFPFQVGQTYRYEYRVDERALGSETFDYEIEERRSIKLRAVIDLESDGRRVKSEAELLTWWDGKPLAFRRKYTELLATVIEGEFQEDQVAATYRSGLRVRRSELELPPETRCFDNNLVSCFALMGYAWKLEPGESFRIDTYHASSMSLIPLTIAVGEATEWEWQGKTVQGWWCDVEPISNRFFYDTSGRLLRVEQGSLSIELTRSDQTEE